MSHVVIVGAQWGDEGKAKVIDYLTQRCDIIVRFQGGANAGHTVIADGEKFIFHLVPSGIMYPSKVGVVANGVVFDAEQFIKEIDDLSAKKISVDGRLFISDLSHLVLPYHQAFDRALESNAGDKKIGTTGRGIGPAYADKVSRTGLRIGDLRDWKGFLDKLKNNFAAKKAVFEGVYKQPLTPGLDEIAQSYKTIRTRLLPMITDTSRFLFEAAGEGKRILFEGAQGTFLDIDHGTYPFVTSSNTVAGAVCTGAGIGPGVVDHVIGIVKAYTTRVGNGPFPTELTDETGEKIRSVGKEFGATTGRPRRCGWFDSVMLRKSVELNGMTRMALTKLDVLNGFDEIKICTHYMIDGKKTEHYPSDPQLLVKAQPVYETLAGWKQDLSGAQKQNDLPAAAQAYIKRLKELSHNIPLLIISIGPDRKQTIEVEPV